MKKEQRLSKGDPVYFISDGKKYFGEAIELLGIGTFTRVSCDRDETMSLDYVYAPDSRMRDPGVIVATSILKRITKGEKR